MSSTMVRSTITMIKQTDITHSNRCQAFLISPASHKPHQSHSRFRLLPCRQYCKPSHLPKQKIQIIRKIYRVYSHCSSNSRSTNNSKT